MSDNNKSILFNPSVGDVFQIYLYRSVQAVTGQEATGQNAEKTIEEWGSRDGRVYYVAPVALQFPVVNKGGPPTMRQMQFRLKIEASSIEEAFAAYDVTMGRGVKEAMSSIPRIQRA